MVSLDDKEGEYYQDQLIYLLTLSSKPICIEPGTKSCSSLLVQSLQACKTRERKHRVFVHQFFHLFESPHHSTEKVSRSQDRREDSRLGVYDILLTHASRVTNSICLNLLILNLQTCRSVYRFRKFQRCFSFNWYQSSVLIPCMFVLTINLACLIGIRD